MRVALNVEQLLFRAPGGTGRYTARLLSGLPALNLGDSVAPFCARHSSEEIERALTVANVADAGFETHALTLPRPLLYEAWHRLGVPHLPQSGGGVGSADVIHAPSPAVPPKDRRPLVVTLHDVAFDLFPQAYPARGRKFHQLGVAAAAKRADLVITVSQQAAREIAEHTPALADRLRVVHNGVDAQEATDGEIAATNAHLGLTGTPYVLWVGSLEPRKDVGTLIRAFSLLLTRQPELPHHLVLVGPDGWLGGGDLAEESRAALGARLHMVGQRSEQELRALYAGATLFAFPSLHEGFGLPVLEAMVQGTPVLCSDIPALREIASDEAAFAPVGDVEAWTQALEGLLSGSSLRAEDRDRRRSHASSFSWEASVAATREVYLEALHG